MLPIDELTRLARLRTLRILDTAPEGVFDETVAFAARLCETPISLVSLVDDSRQWFKAKVGISLCETPREHAFCQRTIQHSAAYIVEDAHLDPDLADNPLVTGAPYIRFYAGVPLELSDGARVGSLCVIDTRPRQLTRFQMDGLMMMGRQLSCVLDHRHALETNRELQRRESVMHEVLLREAVGDSERRALALHEGIAQDLVGGRLLLEGLSKNRSLGSGARAHVQLLSDLLGDAIADCRAIVAGEGTLVLRDEGLAGALRHLALASSNTANPPAVETAIAAALPVPLDTAWEYHVYRIAELALRCARTRPHRRRILLRIDTTTTHLHLSVEDEGAQAEVPAGPADTLLDMLRFRAALLGGTVGIEPGTGLTRVTASVPWPDTLNCAPLRALG